MESDKICVMGMGYIGLPTASVFATHGYEVLGVDVNKGVVDTLSAGRIHIKEPGLATVVKAAVNSKQLRVSSEPQKADVFILAVPTPLVEGSESPSVDLSYLEKATDAIAPFLEKGNLVILESTSPPGTTVGVVGKILEKTGMTAGEDFLLCHCPERVLPGRILRELIQNDRIIGGVNKESALKAKALYESFCSGDIFVTDATTAELCKLVENSYRDVNIAFANELAAIARKFSVNVYDVIKYANKHPRVNILNPGPGVGGHCISVDPWFLVEYAKEESQLIAEARRINEQRPLDVAQEILSIAEAHGCTKVTVLGVTYKQDVDDTRESPSTPVIAALKEELGDESVRVHDPLVDSNAYSFPVEPLFGATTDAEMIVFLVPHKEFRLMDPGAIGEIVSKRIVVDYMQCVDAEKWKQHDFVVFKMGHLKA
jgi:UDP-N-acetyl-D-mannosaminuronic acid dehydrogenase